MAKFELIDDATYRVEGELTEEDIEEINAFQVRTCLILNNTKGQTSEMVGRITNDNAYFSVLGGLDYFKKQKFNNRDYRERTYIAPKGLSEVLKYFEQIESEMKPEWTDTQKCMYVYNALVTDTDYVKDLDQDVLSAGVTERGLNGNLYHQLTCAGIAQTFKEMMDRIGIECYYQNQRNKHDFNVVVLDGKPRGIDATWDCAPDHICRFKNFGRDPYFYQRPGHQITNDPEETTFELVPFTDQEISSSFNPMLDEIIARKRVEAPFRDFSKEKKRAFLPVDKFRENLEQEGKVLTKLRYLSNIGELPNEYVDLINAVVTRYGFVSDYVGENHGSIGEKEVLDEISEEIGYSGLLISRGNQIMRISMDNGQREEIPLTQEEQDKIRPKLLSDVETYYREFFEKESADLDNLIDTYNMIDKMPASIRLRASTLRAEMFSKLKILENGSEFFKKIGIPADKVESVSKIVKDNFEEHKPQEITPEEVHENDLDYLYAIIQNDIIDVARGGKPYSREDLTNLMNEVKANWIDAEFSDEEFVSLLNEAFENTPIANGMELQTEKTEEEQAIEDLEIVEEPKESAKSGTNQIIQDEPMQSTENVQVVEQTEDISKLDNIPIDVEDKKQADMGDEER